MSDIYREHTKGELYHERSLLAVAFVAAVSELNEDHDSGHGWWPAGDVAVVWTDTTRGRVAWGVPKGTIPEWLPRRDPGDDWTKPDEKTHNARVREWGKAHGIPRGVDPFEAVYKVTADDLATPQKYLAVVDETEDVLTGYWFTPTTSSFTNGTAVYKSSITSLTHQPQLLDEATGAWTQGGGTSE